MADTDIKLSVDLDVTDAEHTAQQLQKEVKAIFANRRDNESAGLVKLELAMKSGLQKAQALRQELKRLANEKIPTEEYKEVSKFISDAEVKLNKLVEQQQVLQALGIKSGSSWERLNYKIEEARNTITYAKDELGELVKEGRAFTLGKDTGAYKKVETELDAVNDRIKQQIIRYDELDYAEEQKARKTEESNERVKKSTEKTTRSYRRAGSSATHMARQIDNAFTRRLLPSVKSVRNAVSRMGHSLTKGLQPATKSVKRLAMRFLMLSLGARSMFALLRKVRTAIVKSFEDLQKSGVSPITKQIKELKATLNQVKSSFVAAFEPIIAMILPYLQRMAEALGNVIDKLAQFIAVLSGKNKYIRAIKQVGDAVEESGDKANGSLASFDKLNDITLGKKNTEYEEVEVDESVASAAITVKEKLDEILENFRNFKKQIKGIIDKIKIGDWLGAGADLGGLVDSLLTKLTEKIKNFIPTSDQAEKLGKAIAEFLRNAHLSEHLVEAAGVLGDAIVSIFTIAFTTLKSFDEEELKQFGANIMDAVIKIFDSIITVLRDLPVKEIASVLRGAFSRAWDIIDRVAEILKLVFIKAFSVLWTTLTGDELTEGADKVLSDVFNGLLVVMGINKVIKAITGGSGVLGLLGAFKKKDRALDTQRGKLAGEATAVSTVWSKMKDWLSVLGPVAVGIGLVTTAVSLFGDESEVSEKPVQALSDVTGLVGDTAKDTKKAVNSLTDKVKDLASIGQNSYQLSGIQAISNVIQGIGTSAYNSRLEVEKLKGSLDGSEVPETSGETGGVKKVTTPSKTITYSDIKKYAEENNIPLTSENMSLIADYLATGKSAPKVTGSGTVSGNIKIGSSKTLSLKDIETSTGANGAITLAQPSKISLDALIQAYGGNEKKAWDAYNYIMTSPTFLKTAEAFENGSSEEKILRLLKEQEALGLDIDVLKWVEGNASASQKEQNAEKIKSLFQAAGEHGTSGVMGILEMIKTFFRGFGVPLAKGAVIPAGKPFLAMLGDQKSGTNVEAPLDTIKQALAEVLAEVNMGATFQVIGDPHGMFKVVQKEATKYSQATGKLAF